MKAVGGGNGERKCCDYNLIKTKINLTREIIQKKKLDIQKTKS